MNGQFTQRHPEGAMTEGYGRGRVQHRRAVTDYGSPASKWMLGRTMEWRPIRKAHLQPNSAYTIDLLPPHAYLQNSASALPTKHIHASLNKIKHPINVVRWTPEGRRLLTGSNSGEFTLWNGMGFNFETIMQAHDCAIRACSYSHGADWLLSGDHEGIIKYWQPNFNNVKILQAHKEAVRDLSFSPTDAKFVTASDDGTLKIWNFNEGEEERVLTGHGWDVKCVDWHPSKGLLVSGSKDHLVKLWDPRVARCLSTLHGHKNTVSKALFQPTRGDLLATCARDQTCRIVELRMMKDLSVLKGYEKDISSLTWHPVHPALLTAGGSDGSIHHYLLNQNVTVNGPNKTVMPSASVPFAHEYTIWAMEYHPLGHILCTGSNDRVTRFWSRPRPGETDSFRDRYHLGEAATDGGGQDNKARHRRGQYKDEDHEGDDDNADALVDQKMPIPGHNTLPPGFLELASQMQQGLPMGDGPLGMTTMMMPGIGKLDGGGGGIGVPGLSNLPGLPADFLQHLPPPPLPPLPLPIGSNSGASNVLPGMGNVQNMFSHPSQFPISLDRLQNLLPIPPPPSSLPMTSFGDGHGSAATGGGGGGGGGIPGLSGVGGGGGNDGTMGEVPSGGGYGTGRVRNGPLPSQQESLQAARFQRN